MNERRVLGPPQRSLNDRLGVDSRRSSPTALYEAPWFDVDAKGRLFWCRLGMGTLIGVQDLATLMPVFERLVDETVTQVLSCPAKPDPTFSGFEELLAPIRSATTLEGMLLERGIEAICQSRDDLAVIPLENPLPVIPEARAFLRRNDWSKASALRLGADVHTREFYRPDLVVVDASSHRALILDIKRSVTSHKPKVLTELRTRMMAAALVARDWLERECDAPAVERVEIAIIDGSGEPSDHARAIFSIADLDQLIGIEGAGEAIGALRRLYAARIRDVLLPLCCRIAIAGGAGHLEADAEALALDDTGAIHDHELKAGSATGRLQAIGLSRHRHVSVGIASIGGRA